MYIKKLIFFMAIFLMALPNCFSQQFTYPWNFYDSTGKIQDMHFMPGDSEFIYTTDGGYIRVRNTLTGELKREWPGVKGGSFGFTADSQKIFFVKETNIEVRNISDMSLVASDSLTLGADSLDPEYHTKLYQSITGLALDPIKPFAYLVVFKFNNRPYPNAVDSFMVVAYNYKSMKLMTNLSSGSVEEYYYKPVITISKDGKYLAALNSDAAVLRVWDLPTLKLIRETPFYDVEHFGYKPQDYLCYTTDIKFSDVNNNIIYYSGFYPKDDWFLNGLGVYDLQSNSIIDTTFGRIGKGYIVLFDNEKRTLFQSLRKYVFDLNQKTIEYDAKMEYPDPGTWGPPIIYSKKYDIFIGSALEYCSSGIYDRGSSVNNENDKGLTIHPNPTTSLVSVETGCSISATNYTISKANGDLILRSSAENTNSSIQIDFSSYPNGVYFLTLTCGTQNTTYKIIKEG